MGRFYLFVLWYNNTVLIFLDFSGALGHNSHALIYKHKEKQKWQRQNR